MAWYFRLQYVALVSAFLIGVFVGIYGLAPTTPAHKRCRECGSAHLTHNIIYHCQDCDTLWTEKGDL
jgi:hypothetical protein